MRQSLLLRLLSLNFLYRTITVTLPSDSFEGPNMKSEGNAKGLLMKVICNRGALLEALTVAGSVAAARTPKPILQCVKLHASGNELTVSATDLEVAIRYRDSQVEVTQPGEMLVPADRIRDIVRESIDDTLSIESAAEMAQVKGADSIFKIYTQATEGFPPVPGFEGDSDFAVAGGQLK